MANSGRLQKEMVVEVQRKAPEHKNYSLYYPNLNPLRAAMCHWNDWDAMFGRLIHCLTHLRHSEVQTVKNEKAKSAGHTFTLSDLR